MRTISVKVVHELSMKAVADIVVTAFEGGSNYWIESADSATRDGGWKTYENLAQVKAELGVGIDAGPIYSLPEFWESCHRGYILEVDDGEPVEHVLTANRIAAGLQAMVNDQRHGEVLRIVEGEYDAWDADTLIQYALFSEVVYG